LTVDLTREKFEELTAHLLESTIRLTKELLSEAGVRGFDEIDTIILVGGSTRMPQVREALRTQLGLEPVLYDPDEAVAKGAALMALKLHATEVVTDILQESNGPESTIETATEAQLDEAIEKAATNMGLPPHTPKTLIGTKLVNVLSHSVGIVLQDRAGNEKVVKLVPAQTPLPASKEDEFGTIEDNQEFVEIRVMEGESENPADCQSLNSEENLLALPSGLLAKSKIQVTYTVDFDGSLHVTAVEKKSGNKIKFEVQRPSIMSREEVAAASRKMQELKVE
jgi:molecular chaperone DnaK (HSP70)